MNHTNPSFFSNVVFNPRSGLVLLTLAACGPEASPAFDFADETSSLRSAPGVKTVAVMPAAGNDGLSFDRRGRLFVSNAGVFGASGLEGTEVFVASRFGPVSTYQSGLSGPLGSAHDRYGNLFVANFNDGTIKKRDRSGQVSTVATLAGSGGGLAFDSLGRLYAASYTAHTISRIDAQGTVEIFSDDPRLTGPVGISFDKYDNLYVGNYDDGKVLKILPDKTVRVVADIGPVAGNNIGYLTYSRGCIYATSLAVNKIFAVSPGGDFEELAGTGEFGSVDGALADAQFAFPNGIVANRRGTLFVSEYGSANIRAIRLRGYRCLNPSKN